jgi:hypothetical protein
LLLLLNLNDFPKIVYDNTEVVLYADNTDIIITSLNPTDSTNSANKIIQDVNKLFTANLLSLNADKIQCMQFVTKTISLIDLHIMNKNKEMANTCTTKFLRLTLDNTFSWKNHHIDTIVPKLSSACFTFRAVKPFLFQETPKMVNFSCVRSIMTYRLIFWDYSYHSNAVFKFQKRIMMEIRDRYSCRKYFRILKILPLQSQYMYEGCP